MFFSIYPILHLTMEICLSYLYIRLDFAKENNEKENQEAINFSKINIKGSFQILEYRLPDTIGSLHEPGSIN